VGQRGSVDRGRQTSSKPTTDIDPERESRLGERANRPERRHIVKAISAVKNAPRSNSSVSL